MVQNYGTGHVCLLSFLTHFADLSSWEYAKKLKAILPQVEAAGVQVSSPERVHHVTLSLLAFHAVDEKCPVKDAVHSATNDGPA